MIRTNRDDTDGGDAAAWPAHGEHGHPLSHVLPNRPIGPMRSPARALAWFGIGLGLLELAAPRQVARLAGAPRLPTLVRACAMREIVAGVGILASRNPAPWLWTRVAGDVLDLAAVGGGLLVARRPLRTLSALALLAGITCLDAKVATAAPPARKHLRSKNHDYSARSGFPVPAAEMRGVGLKPSEKLANGGRPAAPLSAGAALAFPQA